MGNAELFCITGNSMAPLLKKGEDAIIIDDTPFTGLKKHDIIVFRVPGNPVSEIVCHRVFKVSRNRENLLEKGDHHFKIGIVTPLYYIGRVKYIVKRGIVLSLDTKRNNAINILLGVLVHIYSLFTSIYLLLHKTTNIDEMCSNKAFRSSFFSSYRLIAETIIKNMR